MTTTIKRQHIPTAIEGMLAFAATHGVHDLAEQTIRDLRAPSYTVDPRDGSRSSSAIQFATGLCRKFRVERYDRIAVEVRELHEALEAVTCATAYAFETIDEDGCSCIADRAVVEAAVREAAKNAIVAEWKAVA